MAEGEKPLTEEERWELLERRVKALEAQLCGPWPAPPMGRLFCLICNDDTFWAYGVCERCGTVRRPGDV